MKPIDRLAENMALKNEREEIMSEMNRRTNESIQIRKENLHLKLENSALKDEIERLRFNAERVIHCWRRENWTDGMPDLNACLKWLNDSLERK